MKQRVMTKAAISRGCTIALLLVSTLGLTQCVPTQHVNIAYQPNLRTAEEPNPKLPPVTVEIVDKRPSPVVGHEIGVSGERAGDIIPEGDVDDELKKAFEIELRNEGFNIAAGGSTVVVNISYFESQYLHPLFGTKIVASMGLGVAVRHRNGSVGYDGFILGQNQQEAEKHFESGPNSASYALNAAMSDAIAKTMADPAFQAALQLK